MAVASVVRRALQGGGSEGRGDVGVGLDGESLDRDGDQGGEHDEKPRAGAALLPIQRSASRRHLSHVIV